MKISNGEKVFNELKDTFNEAQVTARITLSSHYRGPLEKIKLCEYLEKMLDVFNKYLQLYHGSIRLDGERLYAIFALHLICSSKIRTRLIDALTKKPEDRTRIQQELTLRFFQYIYRVIVQIILELRSNTPNAPNEEAQWRERTALVRDEEYLISITHMVSEYCHLEFEITRSIGIEEHLQAVYTSEALLYIMKDRYRNHLWHVIQVWLLGLVFIDAMRSKIISKFNNDLLYLQQNWCIAALFHDVGYALKAVEEIVGQLSFLRSPAINGLIFEVRDTIRSEVRSFANFSTHSHDKDIGLQMCPASDELDHGLVSYSHLCDMFNSYSEGAKHRERYSPALYAIAHHNRYDEPITWDKNPLSVLLVLCDEIQEWHRGQIKSKALKETLISLVTFGGGSSIARTLFLQELRVSLKLNIDIANYSIDFNLDNPDNLEIDMLYLGSEKETGNVPFTPRFLLPYIWFARMQNFQRAEFQDFLNLKITMRHPILPFMSQEGELKLLCAFLNEKSRYSWVELWIDNACSAIQHSINPSEEQLILDVGALSNSPRPILRRYTEILDGYYEWRREWHERQRSLKFKP